MILYEREMNLIGLRRFTCLQEVGGIKETRRNWAPGFLSEQQNESIPLIREGRPMLGFCPGNPQLEGSWVLE